MLLFPHPPMRRLSALDALSPAFTRTQLILFTPFRVGRSWKLAATGYLAMAGVLFLPFPLVFLAFVGVLPLEHKYVGLLAAAVLAFTGVFAFLFHLCSRLNFTFFDLVLNHGEFVAPAWRKYGSASRRWSLCKILYGCFALLVMAAPIAAYVRHILPLLAAQAQRPNQPPTPEFFFAIFGGELFVGLGFLAFFVVGALANDFIVPSLALEDTALAEAFSRLGKLIRYEPGQFALYALVKLVAMVVGYMAVNLAAELIFFLATAVLALIGGAVGLLIHVLGVSTHALLITAAVIGMPVAMALLIYIMLFAAGTMATFLQAYLLCFLGGRYPMLGDLLERSTPPNPLLAPVAPSWPPEFGGPILPPQIP